MDGWLIPEVRWKRLCVSSRPDSEALLRMERASDVDIPFSASDGCMHVHLNDGSGSGEGHISGTGNMTPRIKNASTSTLDEHMIRGAVHIIADMKFAAGSAQINCKCGEPLSSRHLH